MLHENAAQRRRIEVATYMLELAETSATASCRARTRQNQVFAHAHYKLIHGRSHWQLFCGNEPTRGALNECGSEQPVRAHATPTVQQLRRGQSMQLIQQFNGTQTRSTSYNRVICIETA